MTTTQASLTQLQRMELKAVVRANHIGQRKVSKTVCVCVCGASSGGPTGSPECKTLLELLSGVTPTEKALGALKRLLYNWHSTSGGKLTRAFCACGHPFGGPIGTEACAGFRLLTGKLLYTLESK